MQYGSIACNHSEVVQRQGFGRGPKEVQVQPCDLTRVSGSKFQFCCPSIKPHYIDSNLQQAHKITGGLTKEQKVHCEERDGR